MTRKKPPATPRPRFTRLEVNGRHLSAWTRGGSWRPLPASIAPTSRVLGVTWSIMAHTQIYSAATVSARCAGMCFGYERVILIEPDQPEHELLDTAAHELTHAAFRTFADRDRRIATISRETEEAVCRMVAAWLSARG